MYVLDNISAHKPVSIVMIGAGNRARKYLEYFLSAPEKALLVGVVDPNPLRRQDIANRYPALTVENQYSSVDDFFKSDRLADAVIIASPDNCHYQHAMQAIKLGYHVLLEKPIAQNETEANEIAQAAKEAGVVVNICYVLHFHPYFIKLSELVRSGEFGKIVSVSHRSPVGIDRASHVYVRGSWGRVATSGPLFTSKCCHDVDFLIWLIGSKCKKISSFGSRRWFIHDNAPEGSTERCVDCSVEESCPFSAVDLYKRRREWISNFNVEIGSTIDEAIDQELRNGPYGRCVYRCDNDVVDRQVVAFETENGVVVDFSMELFTTNCHRKTRVTLTNGEIEGDEHGLTVTKFRPRTTRFYDFSHTFEAPLHAGADLATIENFVNAVNGVPDQSATDIESALASQSACDAIERVRKGYLQ